MEQQPRAVPSPRRNVATPQHYARLSNKRPYSQTNTPDSKHQAKKKPKSGSQPTEIERTADTMPTTADLVDKTQTEDIQTPILCAPQSQHDLDLDELQTKYKTDVAAFELELTALDTIKLELASVEAKLHLKLASLEAQNEKIQEMLQTQRAKTVEAAQVQPAQLSEQQQPEQQHIVMQGYQPGDAYGQGPDDSTVLSAFENLRYDIIILVDLELKGSPYPRPLKRHGEFFSSLVKSEEDCLEYMTSSATGSKSLFFEAVVWTKVIDRLLSCPLSAFLDVNEKSILQQIPVHSGASKKKYDTWRAYTAGFLAEAFGTRAPWDFGHPLRAQFVAELTEFLLRYCRSIGEPANIRELVENVVDKTVTLARLMAKSRAHWVCSMPKDLSKKDPRHKFLLQKGDMEVVLTLEGGERDIVDLACRPSMVKWGDSSGNGNYDEGVVKRKSCVVVYQGSPGVQEKKKKKNKRKKNSDSECEDF